MWFLPWLLAAVVGIGALWIGIDAALGGDEAGPVTEPPGRSGAAADPSATPEDDGSDTASPDASPTPAETDEPEAKPDPKKKEKKKPSGDLISDGVPIQVLNGTNVSDAGTSIGDKLAGLGFEVVAVNTWHTTTNTVVYWSEPGDQKAAMLLADRFDWEAEPKPSDLSTEVRLHVLVGGDAVTP
jgi:hypothetical protein